MTDSNQDTGPQPGREQRKASIRAVMSRLRDEIGAYQREVGADPAFVELCGVVHELSRMLELVQLGVKLPVSEVPRALPPIESSLSDGGPSVLTKRQREVVMLIAEGLSNKQIAARLGRSIKTIETQRMHAMQRLEVHDIASVVRYAIRMGWVQP